jgi:hypothetical protein
VAQSWCPVQGRKLTYQVPCWSFALCGVSVNVCFAMSDQAKRQREAQGRESKWPSGGMRAWCGPKLVPCARPQADIPSVSRQETLCSAMLVLCAVWSFCKCLFCYVRPSEATARSSRSMLSCQSVIRTFSTLSFSLSLRLV